MSGSKHRIRLTVYSCDRARVGVGLPVEEPYFLAVRQEDERHAELFGVVLPLVLCRHRIGARALGFQRRHRPALPVAEHIVGLRSVGKRVLEQDARPVGQVPACVLEQCVDLDAREGFGRAAHAAAQGSTTSMSISSKSRTLRVATVRPRARAIAAIWQSAGATERPADRRMAAISA